MANKKRGYYTLTIGGQKRTMHFSMNFWTAFTEEMNIPLDKIGQVFEGGISLSGIRALVYAGLLANDQEQGNEIDYNIFSVGTWLDDLEPEKINAIVETMLESKILGNTLSGETKEVGKPKPSKK